ncbi:alpha-glucuronidase family glycosyl hydrolase [Catalinimonas niigatensis]|uniref:alpha-glucuronidase family glycosyl hydrolase n=1 Tax=Catalinimonas niigatensis TaxID=1397264 RepID=UPI00266640C7|nr:alpha-glucuronidase family glycosyl hydrolase [Catalinimonas niigatensis]WPP50040.1 alpha-glucuronidase family glycosyl hydrolase [Catalinimonas niigatensis]
MRIRLFYFVLIFSFLVSIHLQAEDGYRLWLRYDEIKDTQKLDTYRASITSWIIEGSSPTLKVAGDELNMGLKGLLGEPIPSVNTIEEEGVLLVGTPSSSPLIASLNLDEQLRGLPEEGFIITRTSANGHSTMVIAANGEVGVLYGTYHFLKLLQTHQDIDKLSVKSAPDVQHRILNHWDNLDRTVERGYAGFSLWDWHKLPDFIDPRYIDYARANASVGINGTVITSVNANALILTPAYMEKAAALADVFRPYGLKVYLTARFSAPVEIGGLETADPLDPAVQKWWKDKVDEIYTYIPDFGGFLVKANSEGQPGPQDYGRNHAEGANMLADAVAEHGGIVMWRAFVYSEEVPDDRAKQAYDEFKPLDGSFRDNVMVQVKNGAIDFQPREPFHPLFGAMPQTPLMMEFQITQEYLGQATHLVYLAPFFEEVLQADTYAQGEGSTVAKVIDGSLHNYQLTGVAGVANIGTDRNWTGHHFGQANWYAFGRLTWDMGLSSEAIAEEWIGMTFTNEEGAMKTIKSMMLNSHEAVVNYMTPLGLHHIMGPGHHYGPGPWVKEMSRPDWTSVYYHRADEEGIGFDRTASGSNAVAQYFPPVAEKFSNLQQCPDKYLLWFHHLDWDYKMKSDQILWDEIAYHYQAGVDTVRQMQESWNSLESEVDEERFKHVQAFLEIQKKEAVWWKDACLSYFQTFSDRPIPEGVEKPEQSLEYYQSQRFPFAPGIRPRW